jgi:uncharacterized protein YjiS (DUF1127 family)
MSNMSYCRFSNTAIDFRDCLENLRTLDPSDQHQNTREERRNRARLIEMAAQLLAEIGIEDLSDDAAIRAAIYELDHEPVEDQEDDDQ